MDRELNILLIFVLYFVRQKWNIMVEAKYQNYICNGPLFKKQVRSYFSCNPGVWIFYSYYYAYAVEAILDTQRQHLIPLANFF